MSVPPLTAELVRELLEYEPATGIFTWRVARSGMKRGEAAGGSSRGYRRIMLGGKSYFAHRLAWFYANGAFPLQDLDHINGDKTDNRLVNLRPCNQITNQQNRSLSGSGVTGFLGVTFDKNTRKFVAKIKSRGATKHLGLFATALEAHQAYLEAKKTMHAFQGY